MNKNYSTKIYNLRFSPSVFINIAEIFFLPYQNNMEFLGSRFYMCAKIGI